MNNPFAEDVLFEWNEPATIRQRLLRVNLRQYLFSLAFLFPIFAVFGFYLFAMKVWMNGHALTEVSLSGLIIVAVIIATIFSVFSFIEVLLKRLSPITIRLETNRITKTDWGKTSSIPYTDVKSAACTSHPLAPNVSAISITTKTDEHIYLAAPDGSLGKIVEILSQNGIQFERPVQLDVST